ncbi:uncoupling protein [Haematococcus lacustris]
MSTEPVALPLRLALTAAAAATAETVTYPIDFIKTRLQLQGEAGLGTHPAAPPRPAGPGPPPPCPHPSRLSALQLTRSVIEREGVSGLYAGLAPAALRHVFYSGTRILVYEQLRGSWSRMGKAPAAEQQLGAQAAPLGPAAPQAPSLGLGGAMLLGATAGAAGQLVAVPADLVKVRMQADGRLVAAGLLAAPRYQGVGDALRKIVAAEGVRGLWRGCAPAVQRAALVNLGELATYDLAKQALVRHTSLDPQGPGTAAAASLCSGLVASLVSCPADVVKTRVMNQAGTNKLYAGSLDCLAKTVRQEGVAALYAGFWPTWARLGPWQMVFWVTYEQLRRAAGAASF